MILKVLFNLHWIPQEEQKNIIAEYQVNVQNNIFTKPTIILTKFYGATKKPIIGTNKQ